VPLTLFASVGVTVKLYVAAVPAEEEVRVQFEFNPIELPDKLPPVKAQVIVPVPPEVAIVSE
jgi:hypothetical protein